MDSPAREAWHQYVGAALGEDSEGAAKIFSVTGVGVEAQYRGSVVGGELGERVAGEQVVAVIGGIGPDATRGVRVDF
jgi:hypothetical protein